MAAPADAPAPDAPPTGDARELEQPDEAEAAKPPSAPGAPPANSAAPPPSAVPEPAAEGLREAEYPSGEWSNPKGELAQPEKFLKNEYRHDGFFMRLGLGVSYAPRADQLSKSGKKTGPGFEMLFGGTPSTGLVLGGGFVTTNIDGGLALESYSAFAQIYPNPKEGLHFQALLAYSIYVEGGRVSGPMAAAGAGYEFWVGRQSSLGAMLRVGYASLSGKPSSSSAGTPASVDVHSPLATLFFAWTWH